LKIACLIVVGVIVALGLVSAVIIGMLCNEVDKIDLDVEEDV
jgi:hypothetical protein